MTRRDNDGAELPEVQIEEIYVALTPDSYAQLRELTSVSGAESDQAALKEAIAEAVKRRRRNVGTEEVTVHFQTAAYEKLRRLKKRLNCSSDQALIRAAILSLINRVNAETMPTAAAPRPTPAAEEPVKIEPREKNIIKSLNPRTYFIFGEPLDAKKSS